MQHYLWNHVHAHNIHTATFTPHLCSSSHQQHLYNCSHAAAYMQHLSSWAAPLTLRLHISVAASYCCHHTATFLMLHLCFHMNTLAFMLQLLHCRCSGGQGLLWSHLPILSKSQQDSGLKIAHSRDLYAYYYRINISGIIFSKTRI